MKTRKRIRIPVSRESARQAMALGRTAVRLVKKNPSLGFLIQETARGFEQDIPVIAEVIKKGTMLSRKIPADTSTGKSLNKTRGSLIETSSVKGTTESYSMFAYRRPRKLSQGAVKVQAIQTIVDVNTGCSENKRGYKSYMYLAAEPAIDDTPSNDSFYKLTIRELFDKLPKVKYDKDGTTIITNAQSQLIHLGALTNQMTISTPTGCVVDIYDLVPKFDIGGVTRETQFTGTGYGDPRWCVEQGNTSTNYRNLSADTMEAWDHVQFNPETSQTFNRVWKVIKKTRLLTTDGALHRHNSYFGLNKTVTYQKMAAAATTGQLFGGFCPCQMVVITGYPTSEGYSAEITNANIRMDFKMDYHVIPDEGGKYFFQGKNSIA